MFVFTFESGMPEGCFYLHMEEEYQINVCIHVWKNHTKKMYVSTFGKGMLDRSWYSHMEEECEIDVCSHI